MNYIQELEKNKSKLNPVLTDENGLVTIKNSNGDTLIVAVNYFSTYDEKPLPKAAVAIEANSISNNEEAVFVTVPKSYKNNDVLVNLKEQTCGITKNNQSVILFDEDVIFERGAGFTDVNGDVFFEPNSSIAITDNSGSALLRNGPYVTKATLTHTGEGEKEPLANVTVYFHALYQMAVLVDSLAKLGNIDIQIEEKDLGKGDDYSKSEGRKVVFHDKQRAGFSDVFTTNNSGQASYSFNPQVGLTDFNGLVQVSPDERVNKLFDIVVTADGEATNNTPIKNTYVKMNEDGSIVFELDHKIRLLNNIKVSVKESVGGIIPPCTQVLLFETDSKEPVAISYTDESGIAVFRHPQTCIIKFDPNGGDGFMEDQIIEIEGTDKPNLFSNQFERDDAFNNFDRWNTKTDGSGLSFKNESPTGNLIKPDSTITLYAIWVPDYWMATSINDKDNYKHPAYNIKKTSEDIDADVKAIKNETNNGTPVSDEYKEYMQSDKIHLYTKHGDGIDEEDYYEFRIVNVGEHKTLASDGSNNKIGDGTTLTFQMIAPLVDAHSMNSENTNNGGWANSELRASMQPNGKIYESFNKTLRSKIKEVSKFSTSITESNGTFQNSIVETKDAFWIMSLSECLELDGSCWDIDMLQYEGEMYQFWHSAKQQYRYNIVDDLSELDIKYYIRGGNFDPIGLDDGPSTTWSRSCYENASILFFRLSHKAFDEDNFRIMPFPAVVSGSVLLCFAF